MLGTYEYSDFPMDEAVFGVKPGEHIPGSVLHEYLEKYAQHFGIASKIRFDAKVESAEQIAGKGWAVRVVQGVSNHCLNTRKLIVATGMTSTPYLPEISGSESFGVPLFHCRDLPQYQDNLLVKAITWWSLEEPNLRGMQPMLVRLLD